MYEAVGVYDSALNIQNNSRQCLAIAIGEVHKMDKR